MKKALFLLCSVFLLPACSLQKAPDISFQESYDIFVDNLFGPTILELGTLMQTPNIIETSNFQIKWENTDIDLDLQLISTSQEKTKTAESFSNFNFTLNIFDKIKQTPTHILWDIDVLMANQELFIRWNELDLDMWASAEANLINLIVENFISKRIKLDSDEMSAVQTLNKSSIVETYKLPSYILSTLKSTPIFVQTEQTTFQGNPAYAIKLDEDLDLWSGIFAHAIFNNSIFKEFMSEIQFKWLLVTKTATNVELIIQNLSFSGYQDLKITGKIGNQEGEILIDNQLLGKGYRIAWTQKRKATEISYQERSEVGKWPISALLNITPKTTEDSLQLDIDGEIELELSKIGMPGPLPLKWKWQYTIQKSSEFNLELPVGYLLLSDMIGNQYTIPAAIN